MSKTHQTGLRLPESLHFELRRLALEKRTTLNKLARHALEDFLKRQTQAHAESEPTRA